MMSRKPNLVWQELSWQRPFELETVHDMLTHLASTSPRGAVVWEIRSGKNGVRFLIGADKMYMSKIQSVFTAHGDVRFADVPAGSRAEMMVSRQIKVTRPTLSLQTDTTLSTIRAGLAAMANVPRDAEAVIQIVLGPSYAPTPAPNNPQNPHASWFQVATGAAGTASTDSLSVMRNKSALSRFGAVIRIGISGSTHSSHLHTILSAFRTLEAAGVRVTASNEKPEHINNAHVPWSFGLRLSVRELASFLLLPIGDTELPGVAGLHPKEMLPPRWYRSPANAYQDRTFALNGNTRLSISPQDALEHSVLLGPTGSGKSTAMLNLILSDIKAGRSVLVIDPKADLVNDILARIPEKRAGDVVVCDPSDPAPVGFNPFAFKDYGNPALIADAVLSVLKEVFAENWGIRSQDVLSAALLTLAQTDGASLLWLPALLTDEAFRRKITADISDKVGLKPFWDGFEAMKDSERRMEIAPVLNKIRQFLLRPGLRNVLGQSSPKFALTDLFHQRKIVLVPLNKGVIGAESARLLGSLIVGLTWTLALSRANIPQEKRHMVSVYIDELQDYLSLPTDLSDALAQARGLGMALTLAHQYRGQIPPLVLKGIDSNARNKVVFGLNATDAKDMAAMAPTLTPQDFMSLPRYSVYTSFQQGGKNVGWVSGRTLPPPIATRLPADLRARSMSKYGRPAEETEAEYIALLASSDADERIDEVPEGFGRVNL